MYKNMQGNVKIKKIDTASRQECTRFSAFLHHISWVPEKLIGQLFETKFMLF